MLPALIRNALFLALAPSTGPWRLKEFVTTTFQFALPAGIAAGLGVTSSYLFATNVEGADVMTAPPSVIRQLVKHPLTDKGLAAFLADWAKTGQSIL